MKKVKKLLSSGQEHFNFLGKGGKEQDCRGNLYSHFFFVTTEHLATVPAV